MPHLHVGPEVLDLLREREHEEVSDLPKVSRVACLMLEVLEQLDGKPLQADVGFHRELLPHPAGASACRL